MRNQVCDAVRKVWQTRLVEKASDPSIDCTFGAFSQLAENAFCQKWLARAVELDTPIALKEHLAEIDNTLLDNDKRQQLISKCMEPIRLDWQKHRKHLTTSCIGASLAGLGSVDFRVSFAINTYLWRNELFRYKTHLGKSLTNDSAIGDLLLFTGGLARWAKMLALQARDHAEAITRLEANMILLKESLHVRSEADEHVIDMYESEASVSAQPLLRETEIRQR